MKRIVAALIFLPILAGAEPTVWTHPNGKKTIKAELARISAGKVDLVKDGKLFSLEPKEIRHEELASVLAKNIPEGKLRDMRMLFVLVPKEKGKSYEILWVKNLLAITESGYDVKEESRVTRERLAKVKDLTPVIDNFTILFQAFRDYKEKERAEK